MRTALAGWHYPQRTMAQNIDFFLGNGFDAFSAHGMHFAEVVRDDVQAQAVADALAKHGKPMTVHYKLPNPDDAQEIAYFHDSIPLMAQWQKAHGSLAHLTFDFWYPAERILPYFAYALDCFGGLDTLLACEDFPLCREHLAIAPEIYENPKACVLVDIGHMNLRLHEAGDAGADEFARAIKEIPVPIIELHLHNNDGIKDQHDLLRNGNLPMQKVARMLRGFGFDGVCTLEGVPQWHGLEGDAGDAAILADMRLWNEMFAPRGQVTGIGHEALRVRDLATSMEFYCGALGLRPHFALTNARGEVDIQYLLIAPGMYLELFPAKDVVPAPKEASYAHLSLTVDDINAVHERLIASGYAPTDVKLGRSGAPLFFVNDPDGNAVELMQLTLDCMQVRKEV